MKKRLLSLLLVLVMVFALWPVAAAADNAAEDAADRLHQLGLMNGVGVNPDGTPNFDLAGKLTREQAVTMLIRLLGKEEEALNGTWEIPFTDVAAWAKPYVGYAYANDLTNGMSATTFGGKQSITAAQYTTFVLRALGYSSETDFLWNSPWALSNAIGLTSGQYSAANNSAFVRGDMAIISASALDVEVKDSTETLAEQIGVMSEETESAYRVDYSGAIPAETGKRKLTDAQLKSLRGKTPEQAAKTISTLADAYAWLKQEGYSTGGMCLNGSESFNLDNDTGKVEGLSWEAMSTLLALLLDGDYDEVGSITLILKSQLERFSFFYFSCNYVKTEGWYYITDPICHLNNTGAAPARAYTIVLSDLSLVCKAFEEINTDFTPITIAAYPLHKDKIYGTFIPNMPYAVFNDVEGVKYLFGGDEAALNQYQEEKANEREAQFAKIGYGVDYSGSIPKETGERKLSDGQLKALSGKTPEQAAKTISTLADAYAWLKQEGYSTGGMDAEHTLATGTVRFKNEIGDVNDIAWEEMSTLLTLLLDGDYDEVGSITMILPPEDSEWVFYYSSYNYVKTGGRYYITDPLCHLNNTSNPASRAYTIELSDLSLVCDAFREVNDRFFPITVVAYPLHTGDIYGTYISDLQYAEFSNVKGIKYLFSAGEDDFNRYQEEKEKEQQQLLAQWQKEAATRSVSNYHLPAAIGKQTLTFEEAKALVGQDPAIIAEEVKSLADVVQYMIAAGFAVIANTDAYTPWYGYWGFDAPGDEQIRQNFGCCCGGFANTASYLLQGDFEKVGTLRWVGGGNHTISWVYTRGKYYVFDLTQFPGGRYSNMDVSVTVLDRLEDFYDQMPDTYSYFPKSEVVIMVAFETGEAMYPSHWEDPPRFTGLTFPKEAEGKVTVIYQKNPNYGVQFKEVTTSIPGWTN